MDIYNICLLAIGLAMDAFAVSVTQVLICKNDSKKYILKLAFVFALFQMIMPIIGYLAGIGFVEYISSFDHWIIFVVLSGIGVKMIAEAKNEEVDCEVFTTKMLVVAAIATSIDALAVGLGFSVLYINVINASLIIGVITFIICYSSIYIVKILKSHIQKNAEIFGGVILIAIGLKILIEHLFF